MKNGDEVGVLVLIVGPSGAGKDSLINFARANLQSDPRFVVAKRVVTRQDTSGEDHDYASPTVFAERLAAGDFFLSWAAHGLSYGIPIRYLAHLARGQAVIANVSRSIICEAREKWPRTEVAFITVAPQILRERLIARGRETALEIDARVARATQSADLIDARVQLIDNSVTLNQSGAHFVRWLRELGAGLSAPREGMAAYLDELASV